MSTTKKLISFEEKHIEKIDEYCKKTGTSFTQAVRQLAMKGLEETTKTDDHTPEGGMPTELDRLNNDLENLKERVDKAEADKSFWNADETSSQVNNNKIEISNLHKKTEDMEKQLNIVVAIAKKLKGHLENRDIHLQD